MKRAIAAWLPLAWLALSAGANAKEPAEKAPYVDAQAGFQVTVPGGWQQVSLVDGQTTPGAPLVLFANDATDQMLVVTRIDGPTDGAYADEGKFFDAVEAGLKGKSPKYARVSAKRSKLGKGKQKIPAYDLWFRMERDGKKVIVGARFLFFKGYAISLLVDAPGDGAPAATKKILESFTPAS